MQVKICIVKNKKCPVHHFFGYVRLARSATDVNESTTHSYLYFKVENKGVESVFLSVFLCLGCIKVESWKMKWKQLN